MWQENRNSGLVLSQELVSKGRDDMFYHRGMWFFEKENDGSAWLFMWPEHNSATV